MDKILIYALSSSIGGVEEYVLNLSRYNTDMHYPYEYIVLGDYTPYKDEMDRLGVKYSYVPKKRNLIINILKLNRLFKVKREECEYLYFNTSALVYPIPYILAKAYDYKIILHSHSTNAHGLRKYIHLINRKWINQICYKRFACSTSAAMWMFGKKYIDNVTIIPNAINVDKFVFNNSLGIQLRKNLNVENDYVIGHVGRLTYVKNQSFLIDIIYAATKNNIKFKLLLVGDGEDKAYLEKKAKELGIEDRVIFFGRTNAPEKIMNAMDCFIMPSYVEGFPITLVEAQAAGLPCIVSDVVTKEVNITGNVFFESLQDNLDVWIKRIQNLPGRYSCGSLIKNKGYDVNTIERRVRESIILGDK